MPMAPVRYAFRARPRSAVPPCRGGTPDLLRRLPLLAVLFTLSLLLPAQAFAHGALRRAAPGDGDHLPVAPEALRLTFTEDVELAVARLSLVGPAGEVALAPLALHPDSAQVLLATIQGPLVAGTYTVAWQVAGEDGHPVRGTYSFVIAPGAQGLAQNPAGPPAPGQAAPPAAHHPAETFADGSRFDAESPLYAAVRWLTFLGLLGTIGAVAFRLVLSLVQRQEPGLGPALITPASARAAGLGLWMAGLVAVAALLRLYAQSYALHGGAGALDPALAGSMLARTMWGWGWILQAAASLAALAGFALARRSVSGYPAHGAATPAAPFPPAATISLAAEHRRSRRAGGSDTEATAVPVEVLQDTPAEHAAAGGEPGSAPPGEKSAPHTGWMLAALGAVALAFTPALSGHAASTAKLAPLPVVADGLHVLGAGGWLGGLLVLLVAGIPVALRLGRAERGRAVAALINAFSPTALVFAGIVVATGVFAAWLLLGTLPALWQSAYGRTLLLKLAVLSVLFGTGGYNWRRVKPALGDEVAAGRLRRSATLELAVGAVVLAVTAVLVATATPQAMERPPTAAAEAPTAASAGR